MRYQGPAPQAEQQERIGVLLINLGTPDAAETGAVRRYLKEFLSDPRVVEAPRLLWWLILNGIILRTRPARSAEAYRAVWTDSGSPLLDISSRVARDLQERLRGAADKPLAVVLAMRYGNPSIADGLETLRRANARRILVQPLYPQYSATTTASTFDCISEVLRGWRWIPELRFINHYHDAPGYIEALAGSVERFQRHHGRPDRLLISFHGIPQEYADAGDPYPEECLLSARLLAERLGLTPEQWQASFQSRLGNKPWLRPYTDETLRRWGGEGIGRVQVVCPGFPVDCLETIEEIGQENRDYFLGAGGGDYRYIPALNDHPEHIGFLDALIRNHLWR
ncbi:MAG: ferrochelatase [Candidatus Sedimenticola endophacoides]